jgi:hypothetical protein
MVDERGEWRLYSIRTPRSIETGLSANLFGVVGKGGSFTEPLNQPMPGEKEIPAMTAEALLMFNAAIQQGSFDDFYDNVARAWQSQLTKGQLTRAFQGFIDKKVNIAGIRDVEVVFDEPPTLTTEGLLIARGRYPTSPYQVQFALKFIYELPKWKLFGLDVRLAAPPK